MDGESDSQYSGLDAVALGGGYLLLRRWSVVRPVALLAPALYLVSPSLLSVNGFGTTFAGYAFLPLYVYLFLCGLDRFAEGQRRWIGAAYLGGVTLLMVFTDGYSYATALLIICMMLIWWLFRGGAALNARLAALGTFAAANLCALAAYSVYTNAPATPDVGIGAYRYLGLDPVTLFIPEATLWWPSHIGYQPPVLYPRLWGDGSNILHNYMGFAMIGIVAWFLLSRRLRRQPAGQRLEIAPLFVAGSVALFLSLGPAVKIASRAVPISPSWDVPVSKTVIGLPTVFLYRFIPPFDDMRGNLPVVNRLPLRLDLRQRLRDQRNLEVGAQTDRNTAVSRVLPRGATRSQTANRDRSVLLTSGLNGPQPGDRRVRRHDEPWRAGTHGALKQRFSRNCDGALCSRQHLQCWRRQELRGIGIRLARRCKAASG